MGRAREACEWAGEDTLKWYAYVQACKDTNSPSGGPPYYRYVSKTEIKWTSLCAVAHGATGVLYYIFDAVKDSPQDEHGMWDTAGGTNPDSSEVMLAGAVEALDRLDEIAWALYGYDHEYTNSSEPGYDYNVTVSGEDTSWTVFGDGGKGWSIQQITSGDWSDVANWVEVCRWKKAANDECYVILPRDTYNSHNITVTFTTSGQSAWDCDIDGYYQGRGTYVSLTIPKGDCVVLRLYQK